MASFDDNSDCSSNYYGNNETGAAEEQQQQQKQKQKQSRGIDLRDEFFYLRYCNDQEFCSKSMPTMALKAKTNHVRITRTTPSPTPPLPGVAVSCDDHDDSSSRSSSMKDTCSMDSFWSEEQPHSLRLIDVFQSSARATGYEPVQRRHSFPNATTLQLNAAFEALQSAQSNTNYYSKSVKEIKKEDKCTLFVPSGNRADAIRSKKHQKSKRERKTAVGAVGGMVAGCVVLGPAGVILGAAVGGFVSRQIVKKADKRSQRGKEQDSFQDFATSKSIQWTLNDHAAVFV